VGYPYEDLDDSQFERLVVECMRVLFGEAVQSFSTGADGGRDARFHGKAASFPSVSSPWEGITIGQAKHTNALNAHFSDPSFSGDSNDSVLTEEVDRIKKLVDSGEAHNYILFSNRRLGANKNSAIEKRISDFTGLARDKIYLAGIEYMDGLLHRYTQILKASRIDPVDGPLIVSSYELAEVIQGIATQLGASDPLQDAPVVPRVTYEDKNKANKMTPEFARSLKKLYLSETQQIQTFLANPQNSDMLRYYEAAVEDFQLKIIAKRKSYQTFDEVFTYLSDLLFKRDGVLARYKRLTRTMLFYMYWHCDIGEKPDAETE